MASPVSQQFNISSLSGYESFGAMLKGIRNRYGLKQKSVEEKSQPFFRSRKLPLITFRIYGAIEKGLRAPHFDELEALYLTFVDATGLAVEFSAEEREIYLELARLRIEEKQKQRETIDAQQWEELANKLACLDESKRKKIYLLPKREVAHVVEFAETEPSDSRRLRAIYKALHTDTSHLLEREPWVEQMMSLLVETPHKKVIVTQGHMGTGKSHALAMLTQRIAAQNSYYLIPYVFETSDSTTYEDHLDIFLATIYADLTMTASDQMKQLPLEERIDQVITAIRLREEQGQKVIFLLDDLQSIFPSATTWSEGWSRFFESFVREPHAATIYAMTRTWPGWKERRHSFVVELELLDLSTEACTTIWKRFGFRDVDEGLLQRISARCGYNPQMIEMRAYKNTRREFAVAWGGKGRETVSQEKKNANTVHIETLLARDSLFDLRNDISARELLQQVVTVRLSHQAVKMLECLAASPLGMPFSLLSEEFPRAVEVFDELVRASLVDLNAAASSRAAVVPLVREAQLQALLAEKRKDPIDGRVTDIYTYWLMELQDFRDDAEKAALIAEMVVRYIRQRQLLTAAEILINFGWLCALFGHMGRMQRVFDEQAKEDRGKTMEAAYDVGKLLLSYHISACLGERISVDESDRFYQDIYDRVVAQRITLQPHSAMNVLHNMVLKFLDASQYSEAERMCEEAPLHNLQLVMDVPEVYAAFLHTKSRLYARWYEHEQQEQHLSQATNLLNRCVTTLGECVTQWRRCLKNALPLQEHYYHFKLARALNDFAFRQRQQGKLEKAQEAIEESLRLKKASAALLQSLAVSLSEYSQILMLQGKNRHAEEVNGEAVQLMERAIEQGNTNLLSELGMLLKERADILLQQARLGEALPLLQRAVELIGQKKSRQSFRLTAEKQIAEIQSLLLTGQQYTLDQRWYTRFFELAAYDDLAWLAHAGPFSEQEHEEWARLYPRRQDVTISHRLDDLVVQSRQREFALSQEENRAPTLWYPYLPLEEIQHRLAGFAHLRAEIEAQEGNAIVRQLYLEKIDEEITTLRRCAATVSGDQDAVWQCDLALYGKPSVQEMSLALQPFCAMLVRAKHHEHAGPVAQQLIAQLQEWGISAYDFASIRPLVPQQETSVGKLQLVQEKHKFPCDVVRAFFQDVFDHEYRTNEWRVEIAPARDDAYVDINSRTVFLPNRSFSLVKVRELLAEEIETHAYRAMSGRRSPLALLGLGLAHYGPTEEGLAEHRVQRVLLQMHGKGGNQPWMGTLRTGLASGVMTPALSFVELASFLEQAFLANHLSRNTEGTAEELLAEAREEAWIQAARAFRGVPNLQKAGCCSLKDRMYLRGYLDVTHFLEAHDEELLYVGKVGIEHSEALAELHMLTPYYPHRNIALSTDLYDRLSQYATVQSN